MIGVSPAMREVFGTIEKAAGHNVNVLITGESGTGKELVARALHHKGNRATAPFVAINCGAIPPTLLESELFGVMRGAFTDATHDKPGLFEQANGGTLFLDEIGELPPELQVKLLRVLQEREVRRLGATESIAIDVRVIAATLRDIDHALETGAFREDLFFRLSVLPIPLAPLRERREDIAPLVEHFCQQMAHKYGGARACEVSPETMAALHAYSWPGNVRELENVIERAVVLCDGCSIGPEMLPAKVTGKASSQAQVDPIVALLASGELSIKKTMRVVERELIRRALESTGGNRTSAAKLLEISHRALLYKIKEYGS